MKRLRSRSSVGLACLPFLAVIMLLLPIPVAGSSQQPQSPPFVLERIVEQLPAGPLYWRIQTFPTVSAAEAVAGPTGQVGEAEGAIWLFTLGQTGGASPSGTLIDEIGPLEAPVAERYLLRIGYSITPPRTIAGGGSFVHTHPGTEAFYILAGEQTVILAGQQIVTGAGQSQAGLPADTPMVVVSSGDEPRRALTLFLLDADRPFTAPALFPAP